jgi:hypothetical protein
MPCGCPYVFTTTGTTSISGFSGAKQKLDDLMGIVTDPAADGYDLCEAMAWARSEADDHVHPC